MITQAWRDMVTADEDWDLVFYGDLSDPAYYLLTDTTHKFDGVIIAGFNGLGRAITMRPATG
ncbi:MAG: hypothetical protein KAT90_15310, partial [Gammaproteobacteria bacterium]|nr:hypothetical protein [Gammaproteobacteria bacterium]